MYFWVSGGYTRITKYRKEVNMAISLVFLLTVFVAGLLSFFSPCIFPLLPVYLGILLGQDEKRTGTFFG